MNKLDYDSIPHWKTGNLNGYSLFLPTSINSFCPHCKEKVNFVYNPRTYDNYLEFLLGYSSCPNCQEMVSFIISRPLKSKSDGLRLESLYILPEIQGKRNPIDIDFKLEKLNRAYLSAVESYNAKLWDPTVTMCRQVLEGIAKTNVNEKHKNISLFEMLKKLPESIKLDKPILDIADLIREGGNLGAHFDLEKEADSTIALEMLDMLEYLIEYLYQLPNKIEKLKEKICKD
jgi:hypothetical protein